MAVTLTTLRSRVRERADMSVSTFIADTATGLDAIINEGVQKLHAHLVDAMGEEYISSTTSAAVTSGVSDYALPSDFFKLYGVDLSDGSQNRALRPYMRAERNLYRYAQPNGYNNWPRYSLVGGYLRLYPAPSGGTYTLLYAPNATVLVNGSDSVTFPNGWERYVVLYAAIQALLKEESSVTGLMTMLEKEEQELSQMKQMRDLAHPKQVVDLDAVDYEPRWW